MEVRKVQKTGDMHYVYLPTNWCKKHRITSKTRVNIGEKNNGALLISPSEEKTELKNLQIKLSEDDQDVINKLIVACYLNPLASFRISLNKEITAQKLLNQKNIVGLESVEIEKKNITCESTVMLSDPAQLLRTMVKKIKNLAVVMAHSYNEDLVNRYEEEIDRSNILIQKSIINYMTFTVPVNLRMIDLYYISLVTTDLERMVDQMIKLKAKDSGFTEKLIDIINVLRHIIDSLDKKDLKDRFDYEVAITLIKKIKSLEEHNLEIYVKKRISDLLTNISESVLDWAITNQIDA